MELPSEDEFEAEKPNGLSNWAAEKKYESSFRLVNQDTGEHVQAMVDFDQEQVSLTPMLHTGGKGYSSATSKTKTCDGTNPEDVIDTAWGLARQIKSGEIGRDDSDFSL